ncbi:MAG: MBL fold metallo-hydrolase, partial [Nitrospira sp.]|nr:MBL fold metallo-hydrolase [Nitrospira sp.]
GIRWRDIRSVFMTHFHSDHCGLAGRIKETSGASLVMESGEAAAIENFQATPLERLHNPRFYEGHGLPTEKFEGFRQTFPYLKSLIYPFKVDERIEDGEEIELGDLRFEAVWTPGHTPGHVCLYHPERKLLFCGDHILMRITPNISLNSRSTLANPLCHYLDSLRKIMKLDVTLAFPSHGPIIQSPKERAQEIILHHDQRKEALLTALGRDRKSAYQLCLDIFGNRTTQLENWFAFSETLSHLALLVSEEKVKELQEDGRVLYRAK